VETFRGKPYNAAEVDYTHAPAAFRYTSVSVTEMSASGDQQGGNDSSEWHSNSSR